MHCLRIILFLCLAAVAGCTETAENAKTEPSVLNPIGEKGRVRFYGFGADRDNDYSLDEYRAMGVNLFMPGLHYSLSAAGVVTGMETKERLVQKYHAAGMKVTASCSQLVVAWKQLFQTHPEAANHVVLTRDGKPLQWQDRPHQYVANLLDPYWLNFHVEGHRNLIKLGCDMTHLDNSHLILSYEPATQEHWNRYLRSALGREVGLESLPLDSGQLESQTAESLGADIPFNIGDAERSRDQVVQAHLEVFRYSKYLEFLGKLRKEVRSIRPDYAFDFTAHMGAKDLFYWVYGQDFYDVICIENAYAQAGWFPPVGEDLFGYKLAQAASGNKPVWVISKLLRTVDEKVWVEDAQRFYTTERMNPSRDRQELYLAEALASEGMIAPVSLAPHHAKAWNKPYLNYRELVTPYYKFMTDHEGDLSDTASIARTALLVSARSYVFDQASTKKTMFAVAEFLFKKQIPFDVVIVESGNLAQLSGYTSVVAVNCLALGSQTGDEILRAVQQGMHLVVSGEFATRDDQFRERSGPLWPELKEAGTTVFGEGSVTLLPFDAGDLLQPFFESQSVEPEKAQVLEDLLLSHAKRQVRALSGDNGTLVLLPRQKTDSLILHLLNYDFEIHPELSEEEKLVKDKAREKGEITFTVDSEVIPSVSSVTAYHPMEEPQTLEFWVDDGVLSFRLPDLHVYRMIKIE